MNRELRKTAVGNYRKKPRKKKYKFKYKEKAVEREAVAVKKHQCDFTLLTAIILLSFVGIVMITSSSYYYSYNKFADSLHFFKRQFMWLVVGFGVMFFMMNFNYKMLKRFALPIYVISNFFLILVLLIGKEINGAKRWIEIAGPIGFQPSEFAKVATLIFMAYYLSKNYKQVKSWSFLLKSLALIGIPILLIAIENLSTAIVVMSIGMALVFLSGVPLRRLIMMFVPVGGLGAFFLLLPLLNIPGLSKMAEDLMYRIDRIQIWFNPWLDPLGGGFQTIQSLYAVGSGGLFGVGLGQSMQKRGFIPEAHNDIIFSIICEELGLFGAAIVLLLFLILIWRGIKVSMNAPDLFSSLLAAGAVTQVAVQVIINVAVNTNTIPVTGMPLPFISYGGSSLLFLMISMGILLNISRYSKT